MQRRDVLALHVASDPGLALDLMVFTLADADTLDWRARSATTLRGACSSGADHRLRSEGCSGKQRARRVQSPASTRAGALATDVRTPFRPVPGAVR
jgi:ParB family chromosome partitioning protein